MGGGFFREPLTDLEKCLLCIVRDSRQEALFDQIWYEIDIIVQPRGCSRRRVLCCRCHAVRDVGQCELPIVPVAAAAAAAAALLKAPHDSFLLL